MELSLISPRLRLVRLVRPASNVAASSRMFTVSSVTSVSRPPMTPARATAPCSGVEMTVMSLVRVRFSPSSVVSGSPSCAARTTMCARPLAFFSLSRSNACSGWPNRNRM